MTTRIVDMTSWEGDRDQDGNRTYKITFRVESTDPMDGPFTALSTRGLPKAGDVWNFGNDNDEWAFCRQETSIKPVLKGEPNLHWDITYTFTSKSDEKRCKDQQIEDPLQIPPRVSGSFQKYQEEATEDRFGIGITNSAWEQFRGAQVEFDKNRPSIKIELNIPSFITVALAYTMLDHVNKFPLWGFPKRCIKLSSGSFNVKYYGQCFKYYELSLEFDIRQETFDRDLLDESTKVLHGHWGDDGSWVVDLVGGITAPLKPTLSSSRGGAGAIIPNTYFFRITALNALDLETNPGPRASIVIAANNDNNIIVSWAPVPGAHSYNVYASTISGSEVLQGPAHTITVPTATFTSINNAGTAPPVTNNTGAVLADRSNPQHFDHAKDRNGENIKLILDGAGQPAGVLNSNSLVYISLVGHSGQALTDTSVWLPVKGSYDPVNRFDTNTLYKTGELVAYQDPPPNFDPLVGGVFIALRDTPFVNIAPTQVFYWRRVGNFFPSGQAGAGFETSLLLEGQFNITETYGMGSIVLNLPEQGKIHVEKYEDADFLLLGIPTTF